MQNEFFMKTPVSKFIIGAGLTVAAMLTAHADIIPTFSSITTSGADFRWNYSTAVTQSQEVLGGSSFFTIYDFKGFVPGSNQEPAGWTFSSSLTGLTPAKVIAKDDPKIPNLTWSYTGATKVGPFNAGLFSALSNTNLLSKDGTFAAQAIASSGPNAGSPIDNVGSASVPVPEMSALMPIAAVCGLGLVSFVVSQLRRRQALI